MKRYAVSLAILILGVFWIGVGAPVWSGINLLEESEPAPRATASPTESPEKEAQVRGILFQNDSVKAILAGREEGRHYWLKIFYGIGYYGEAKDTGEEPVSMVHIYFDPPVSWAGEVPTRSDPCQGHSQDGWLDPNDPCRNELPEFGTTHYELSQAQEVTAEVDLRRAQVVHMSGGRAIPFAFRVVQREYATPGSPEDDARVREILFQNEALTRMLVGREEGREYWVRIVGYLYAPREPSSSEEKTLAMVDIYFDPPLDWSGPLPIRLDPCQGRWQEGGFDPNDPCISEPPQFGPAYREFYGAQGVTADVDLRSGQVLEILPGSPRPEDIEEAQERYAP